MRSVILSLVGFAAVAFAPSAMAGSSCPKWNGHYVCTYNGQFGHKVFQMDIKTTDQRGQTVYVANGKEIYTDGQSHHTDSLPILEEWADDINYTASCSGPGQIDVTEGNARVKKGMMQGRRATLTGSLIEQSPTEVAVKFNVVLGFFNVNFNVPCVLSR